jgi:TonB family protein
MRPMLALAVVPLAIHATGAQTRAPGTWVDSVQTPAFRVDIVGTDQKTVLITVRSGGRMASMAVPDTDARIFSESALAILNQFPQSGSHVASRARLRFEYVGTGDYRNDTVRFGFAGDSGIGVQGGHDDVGHIIGSVHAAALWSAAMTRLSQTRSSAPTGAGATGQTYFDFQVTTHVWPKQGNVAPHFPDSLRIAGTSGEVLAQFVVDTTGYADMTQFRVLKSTHALFTQAVKDALPKMEFTPAEIGGRRVRQLVQMPFSFYIPPPEQAPAASRCDSIQYRFVDDGASTTARRYRSARTGESYALRDTLVLDGRGIAEVLVRSHAVGTDTTWDVIARLTPAGASAIAEASASHIGQKLAVLMGNEIVDTGIIETPLRSLVVLRIGASRGLADSLALRARRASGTGCLAR